MRENQKSLDDFTIEHVNTGCLYEAEGQKITILHGVDKTHFFDHSRMIDATIDESDLSTMEVIRRYVRGQHTHLSDDVWDIRFEVHKFYGTATFKDVSNAYKWMILSM